MFNGGMLCSDCHGNMEQVGNDFSVGVSPSNPSAFKLNLGNFYDPASAQPRVPWAHEPGCGSCHTGDAVSNLAGTTGTEFQTMYTTLLNWATGFLGKSIAIAAFILGAGIGIARSSPIPALAGVVFALFMVYVPTIIDSIMTAVI